MASGCMWFVVFGLLLCLLINAIGIDTYVKGEDIRKLRRINKWLQFLMGVIIIVAFIALMAL